MKTKKVLKPESCIMLWFTRFFNLIAIIFSYLISILTRQVFHRGMPLAASIEPTNYCNLACPECPSGHKELTRSRGYMEPALFRSIIDQLSPQLTYLTYYFQGEPYLYPGFFDCVSYARSKKIFVSTSTNAHFLSQENVEKTIRSGLNRLIVSLDGIDQETYASYRMGGNLEKVTEGIKLLTGMKKRLKSKTPYVIIQFLVLKTNQHQIHEIRKLGIELGADKVELKTAQFSDYQHGNPLMTSLKKYSRYTLINHGPEGYKSETYRLQSRRPDACFRMWSSCVFSWDGKVVPCCFDKDARHVLGDLNTKTFQEIWKNRVYSNFRKTILKNRKSVEICNNCTQTF